MFLYIFESLGTEIRIGNLFKFLCWTAEENIGIPTVRYKAFNMPRKYPEVQQCVY